MRFTLPRSAFLKTLNQVVNVVERRHTLPVLGNFLVHVRDGRLSLNSTDMEVEMVSRIDVEDSQEGQTTIPARKLFEIIRALPDDSRVTVTQNNEKVTVQAARSRFSLATLPASDFPSMDESETDLKIAIQEKDLKELIERTAFAMGQQDVRQYLNGLLFDLREKTLRCVATDGHRLALSQTELETDTGQNRQIVVPRKGVLELQRLLESGDQSVELEIGHNHIRVRRGDMVFTSRLIDGRFPDYEMVLPVGADQEVKVDRENLRASLQRVMILSNEKYCPVRIEIEPGQIKISAHNQEQEEAQEEIAVDTNVENLVIGFNANYLLDTLSALREEQVLIYLRDASASALVRELSHDRTRHVVMPLRV